MSYVILLCFQFDSDVFQDQIFYYFSKILGKTIYDICSELNTYVSQNHKAVHAIGTSFLRSTKHSPGYYTESMKCDNFQEDELTVALISLCYNLQVAVFLEHEVLFVQNRYELYEADLILAYVGEQGFP